MSLALRAFLVAAFVVPTFALAAGARDGGAAPARCDASNIQDCGADADLQACAKAAREPPYDAGVWETWGDLLACREKWEAAASVYEGASQLFPKSQSLRLELAEALWRSHDEAGSARVLETLVGGAPPEACFALVNLAALELRNGHQAEAESKLRRAQMCAPEDARILARLGNFYALQKRWGRAQRVYEACLDALDEHPARLPEDVRAALRAYCEAGAAGARRQLDIDPGIYIQMTH